MAVTYGFYNSLNKDRMYNAQQMSAIFDGIITDGVFGAIGDKLMPVAGTGMQVIVKTGKCWFNSTWTLNDAQLPLDIETADVSLTRIDAIVVEINSAVGTRANSIKVIKGTASANPAKPTLSATENLHQYALGYVTVGAGVTSITAANIEVNVGKTTCPFITSVLQQTDITDLFNQWDAEFNAWFSNVQSQLSGDIAANLQRQIDENWANTLKDATKTKLGLASSAIPDDAFNALNTAAKNNFQSLRYTEFLTSGTWKAPENLGNNGEIWIFGIGGGGGGAFGGGGSGRMKLAKKTVTAGESYTVVIGAGGAGASDLSVANPTGSAGGASSFGGDSFFKVLGGSGAIKYNGGNGGAGGGAFISSSVGNTDVPVGGDGEFGGGGGGGCGGNYTTPFPRSGGNGGPYGGGGGAGSALFNYNQKRYYRSSGGSGGTHGGDGGSSTGSKGATTVSQKGEHGEVPFIFTMLMNSIPHCEALNGPSGLSVNDSFFPSGAGGGGYGGNGGDPMISSAVTNAGGGGGGGYFADGGTAVQNASYGAGGGGGFFGNGGDGGYYGGGGGGGGYFGPGGTNSHTEMLPPSRGGGGAGGRNGSNALNPQDGASGVIAIWYFVDEEAPNEF